MDTAAFTVIRGDTLPIEIALTDDDGNPIDLTGYDIFFTAKENPKDTDDEAVLKKEVDNGTSEGIVTITFDGEDTDLLKNRNYWWDIQLVKDGEISSTEKQLFRVKGDVTRRTEPDAS